MGYASTVVMIWGIELEEDEAALMYNTLYEPLGGDDPEDFNNEPGISLTLVSDGTDSRIQSLVYDEGQAHFFGIFLASKGYVDYGDFKSVINGKIPAKHKNNWSKCVKVLEKCGIKLGKRKPSLVSATQVW